MTLDTTSLYAMALSMGLWGSALYYLRTAPVRLWTWARGRFSVSMRVDQQVSHRTHRWITLWLAENPEIMRRCRAFLAAYQDGQPTYSPEPGNSAKGRAILTLGDVRLIIRWRGKRVLVHHALQSSEKTGATTSTFHLTIFGGAREDLLALLREGHDLDEATGVGKIEMWTPSGSGGWCTDQRLAKRAESTLVMAAAVKERLLTDARRFFESADKYSARGVPWRRGYLLYGPPGTGKSTFALVLASELGAPLYKLNPNDVSDTMLARLLRTIPARSVLLIEDLDAAVAETPRRLEQQGPEVATEPVGASSSVAYGVTLAGLLNALDGVGCGEGRLLVCTTNHPERLPPALVRAGRLDVKQEVGLLTPDQVARFAALWERPLEVGAWTGRAPVDLQQYLLEGLA